MRIVSVACTHGYHKKLTVPDGDLFIFAGDYTCDHRVEPQGQLLRFNYWLGKLPHANKIVVAGNHDFYFQDEQHPADYLLSNATYLSDALVIIDGLKIWGSPVTPTFMEWAFMREPGSDIQRHWDMIPEDVDILVTHGPPYGILDLTKPSNKKYPQVNAGSTDLKATLPRLKQLKLHVFGHIHEGYGKEEHDGVLHVNASKGYHPVNNPPVVVDIKI